MNRTIAKLILVAASALALAACEANPVKPEPPAPPPAPKKTLVEMEYELRKLEIEGQNAREERTQKALIKFGADSDNDFAKGVVAGLLAGRQPAAPAEAPRRSLMDSQVQADAIELKKLEIEYQNSWFNRGLKVVDRALGFQVFKKNLGFQQWQIEQTNSQNRYTLDTVRGAQADGFAAGSGATLGGVSAGHNTTLGGFSAARQSAPATPTAGDTTTETTAE